MINAGLYREAKMLYTREKSAFCSVSILSPALFGGYALTNLQIGNIFLLFSFPPTIQLLSCGFVTESPISNLNFTEFPSFNASKIYSGSGPDKERSSNEAPKPDSLVIKRSHKSSKKKYFESIKDQMPEKEGSLPLKWFWSLKMVVYTLFEAFRQPIILRYNLINSHK